jgi:hypothetical protein
MNVNKSCETVKNDVAASNDLVVGFEKHSWITNYGNLTLCENMNESLFTTEDDSGFTQKIIRFK